MEYENLDSKFLTETCIKRRDFIKEMGCEGLALRMGLPVIGCDSKELREPYQYTMYLTDQEKAVLRGDFGLTAKKVMETVVRYGEIWTDIPIVTVHRLGEDFLEYVSERDTLEVIGDGTVRVSKNL
jgi:hypothetical protein